MAFKCVYAGYVILAIAAFFHSLSVASSYWVVADELNHTGLWLRCTCDDCAPGTGQSICHGLSKVPGVLTGVRILAVASLSLILIAYCLTVFGYMRAQIRLAAAAAVVVLVIAGSLGAGLILYTVNYSTYADLPNNRGSLGWALYVGWVAVAFHIAAGSCFLAETMQSMRQFRGYYPMENGLL